MTPAFFPGGVCFGLVTGLLILLFPVSFIRAPTLWQTHLKYLRLLKFSLDLFKCDDTNDEKLLLDNYWALTSLSVF